MKAHPVVDLTHHWSLSVYDWTENLITDVDLGSTTFRKAQERAFKILTEVPEAFFVAIWDEETNEREATYERLSLSTSQKETENAAQPVSNR